MQDIFEQWRKERFIVVPKQLLDEDEILIVLTDVGFWLEYSGELYKWCEERSDSTNISGMTIVLNSEELLTEFILKWG